MKTIQGSVLVNSGFSSGVMNPNLITMMRFATQKASISCKDPN
jgi:N-acetylglutamate synthase/N-acetylornithine aminotransferase